LKKNRGVSKESLENQKPRLKILVGDPGPNFFIFLKKNIFSGKKICRRIFYSEKNRHFLNKNTYFFLYIITLTMAISKINLHLKFILFIAVVKSSLKVT